MSDDMAEYVLHREDGLEALNKCREIMERIVARANVTSDRDSQVAAAACSFVIAELYFRKALENSEVANPSLN